MTEHAVILERRLWVHGHLQPHEHQGVLRHWGSLERILQAIEPELVDLQLFVDDRDTVSQHVTLEVRLTGHRTFVATAASADLTSALHDVHERMVRQLRDMKEREAPRHDRTRREQHT